MSHRKERREKNCLNCGANVLGRYCHKCGQENVEPKETFWHLVTHFVYDLTHFDGKFFSTMKYLLLRPGFLPYEYMRGRRMSYLNPLRMYIFTSAFFFVFFFSVTKTEDMIKIKDEPRTYAAVKKSLEREQQVLKNALKNPMLAEREREILDKQLKYVEEDLGVLKTDTTNLDKLNIHTQSTFSLRDEEYKSVHEYDSVQKALPKKEKDGWLEYKIQRRELEIKEEYGNLGRQFLADLFNKFLHTFPQLLFVSLPLFALILRLLYVRHKTFFYADHIIFSVHLYIAMFIMIFLLMSVSRLGDVKYLGWISFLKYPLALYIAWYIPKSMRVFYSQGWPKTIVKFTLLLFIAFFVMMFLFLSFFVFSVFTL